jgi:hypothetical protein
VGVTGQGACAGASDVRVQRPKEDRLRGIGCVARARVSGSGFRVSGFGFRQGVAFGVWVGFGVGVWVAVCEGMRTVSEDRLGCGPFGCIYAEKIRPYTLVYMCIYVHTYCVLTNPSIRPRHVITWQNIKIFFLHR